VVAVKRFAQTDLFRWKHGTEALEHSHVDFSGKQGDKPAIERLQRAVVSNCGMQPWWKENRSHVGGEL
jgi:hypothetical protein